MSEHRLSSLAPRVATYVLLLGLFAFGSLAYPNFASVAVVRNLLVDNAFLAVAAVGATFVILSGGIDLSVGSVMAFTSILVATLIEDHHVHPLVAFAAAIVCGGVFGTVQGALIAKFELPAFMVTLAGMFFARGAAFAVHPQSVGIQHPFVANTLNDALSFHLSIGARGTVIPVTVPVLFALFAAAWFVLRHMRFGRAVYAIGDDASAALLMGLAVDAMRVRVYALSGMLSALAGVFFCLYQQSGDPASCKGMELDVIAAVIIGGTLLRGGVGTVAGSFAGVLILGIIQTIISFQGDLSSWWTRIVAAGIVLLFLLMHRLVEALSTTSSFRRSAR
jgi:simple sugar transport system permease protein